MTHTKQVAKLLAQKPCTQAEICKALGLSKGQVRTAICELTRLERVKRSPLTYALTKAGVDFSERTPQNTPSQLAKRAAQEARRRERIITQEALSQQSSTRIVEIAKRSRPALEAIWGGASA